MSHDSDNMIPYFFSNRACRVNWAKQWASISVPPIAVIASDSKSSTVMHAQRISQIEQVGRKACEAQRTVFDFLAGLCTKI